MSVQAADVGHWIADNWIWVLIVFWCAVGGIAESWRKAVQGRRRHQINLALARRGIAPRAAREDEDEDEYDWEDDEDEQELPAAVIPAPPGARPLGGVPGPCRHERIIPVIDGDGGLCRWICANYPRCEAEFDKSVAVYEPGEAS